MKLNGVALSGVYAYKAPQKQTFGAKLEMDSEATKHFAKNAAELEGSRLMKKVEKIHPEQTVEVKYVPETGGYAPLWGPVYHPERIKLINKTTGKATASVPIDPNGNTLEVLLKEQVKKSEFWQK